MVPLGFRGREEREEKEETREEREGDEEEEEERGEEEETIKIEKNPPRSVSREARYSYLIIFCRFSQGISMYRNCEF